MVTMLVTLGLIICVVSTNGHKVRQDPDNPPSQSYNVDSVNLPLKREGFGPDHQPQQWQDLVTFVNRKIESMERLLTEKDERIEKLELNMASQVSEIQQLKQETTSLQQLVLEKDDAVNRLVTKVAHLERMFDSITSESETGQNVSSQFPRTNNETELGLGNKVEKISIQQLSSSESSNQQYDSIAPNHSEQHMIKDNNSVKNQSAENTVAYTQYRTEDSSKAKHSRFQQKRVVPSSSPAFHVAISGNRAVTPDIAVTYDHVMLDQGNGYNAGTGLYTVPESGIYVLTWTTVCNPHDLIQTILVVNGVRRGLSWTDSQEINDYHQTTAVVVLTLNQGDHVFIRMGHTYGTGTIVSRSSLGESTFSGWKID